MMISPGGTISFGVTWGSNISPFRWSRIWPAIQQASDEDTAQAVTIVSEGSAWNAANPAHKFNIVTLRAQGQSGAPVVARIEVMSSQVDTFWETRMLKLHKDGPRLVKASKT